MGFKKTSNTLVISSSVTETAANTFTQAELDLALDPLSQEVFVVQAINCDVSPPSNVAANSTASIGSVSVTSRTTIGGLQDNNVIAMARDSIQQGPGTVDGAAFSRNANETFQAEGLEYIGIIATSDAFLQVLGVNNLAAATLSVKIFGFRAKMDAAGYAAMVQSELLSQ